MRQDPRFQIRALAAAAMLVLAIPASAQLSSATVRGDVTADAKAQAGASIVATNVATGQTTRTTSRADGSYTLVGLAPGSYKLSISAPGFAPQALDLTVLVGQTVDLDLPLAKAGATQLSTVTVIGTQSIDRKTSEVGTNVTTKQIEALPQNSRNFLAFADLAPGVRVDADPKTGQVTLRGGAQNRDNTNVFIDGVGQKNYILRGGVSGLDSTRGNPFPQSAIGEYKVLSSNYKAEFDQVSSTAISAVTKSGTNEFHGDVFVDRTGTNWRAYSPFEKLAKDQGVDRQSASTYQYGFSLGGPIKQDVAHFFLAYEGKDINDSRSVIAQRTDLVADKSAGLFPSLIGRQGSTIDKFKEHLLLGKLDLLVSGEHKLILTTKLRRESDKVPESPTVSVPGNDKDRSNDETRIDLKHEWSHGDFFNEARIGYEDYRWNPHSSATTPFLRYKISQVNLLAGASDFLWVGGSPDAQDRQQKAWNFQEDLTYTGLLRHTIKGGFKFKDVTFNLSGTPRSVDIIETVLNNTTGLPYYDAATRNCTTVAGGASGAPAGTVSDTLYCHQLRAEPGVDLTYKNKQIGLYIQDDWAVTPKLELNLGVRWDYETNMLNDKYVTPADRVAALFSLEPVQADGTSAGRGASPAGLPVAPGQTYDQSLAKGGINIRDYIANGSSRKAFKGAFQPRIGFSYDINGDQDAVLFGGFGRAYDRTIANHMLDELQKNQVPNGEIWLIKNDHKMPYTDQFSLGLRKGIAGWNGEVGASYARGHNQFNWFGGNRDPQGGWGNQSPIDPLWGGPKDYGTLILGDFITQTKTMSVYFKMDKPYTKSSGWGAAATYTYTDAKTTNKEWTDDIFNWTYGRSSSGFNPSTDVERHRIVATAVTDRILPWGLLIAGKMTLGSGLPYRITDCSKGFNNCVSQKGDTPTFRQFDLTIAKDVAVGIGQLTFRVDVINLFNTTNYKGYDAWGGGPGTANYLGGDNAHLGVPNDIAGPMRTLKVSMRYAF